MIVIKDEVSTSISQNPSLNTPKEEPSIKPDPYVKEEKVKVEDPQNVPPSTETRPFTMTFLDLILYPNHGQEKSISKQISKSAIFSNRNVDRSGKFKSEPDVINDCILKQLYDAYSSYKSWVDVFHSFYCEFYGLLLDDNLKYERAFHFILDVLKFEEIDLADNSDFITPKTKDEVITFIRSVIDWLLE